MYKTERQRDIFSHWVPLESDNIWLPEVSRRFSSFPERLGAVRSVVAEYYQLFLMSQSIQMVIGGLKPATNLNVDISLVRRYKSSGLLEKFDMTPFSGALIALCDIRLDEMIPSADENQRQYMLYNPAMINQLSFKYDELNEYREENIFDWLESHKANKTFVEGLIYGYPISAVKQMTEYETLTECKIEGRRRISSYGESYMVWGDKLKRDVIIREDCKEAFFTNLAANSKYLLFMDSMQNIADRFRSVNMEAFNKKI